VTTILTVLRPAGNLGSESHHLYGFQNANNGIPSPVSNAASHLPWKDFGFIQLVADGMNATYNSLALKVTKRFSQGMSVISSYTYSKSIDDSSGIRVQGYDTLFPQNNYCIRLRARVIGVRCTESLGHFRALRITIWQGQAA
jgi:hypothetical protein